MKKSASLFLGLALVSSSASATSSLSSAPPANGSKQICRPEFRVTGRDTGRRVCATYAEWRHFDLLRARARQGLPKVDIYPDQAVRTPAFAPVR